MSNKTPTRATKATRHAKPWWIKERYNSQLGTYYVAMGQMSKTAAKKYEKPLHGSNAMYRFDTEQLYLLELKKLRANGESVQ